LTVRRVTLLLVALTACAPKAPGPAEVVIAPPSPPVGSAAPDPSPSRTCHATLVVREVAPDHATCFVDAKVAGHPGDLSYACNGGPAEARFPGAVFRGTVVDGDLDVSLSTQFDWNDGCKWRSEQHLRGAVAPGKGSLEYTYTEAPLDGQEDCSSSCTARAQVEVRRPDTPRTDTANR
jgi:hypothetical protein